MIQAMAVQQIMMERERGVGGTAERPPGPPVLAAATERATIFYVMPETALV